MRAASIVFGVLFILFAIAGMINPGLWGMNLSAGVNAFHMSVGILAIVFGAQANELAATWFCWMIGAVYFGLGVSGVLGSSVATTAANYSNDAIHWILGGLLFISGYLGKGREAVIPAARQRERVA